MHHVCSGRMRWPFFDMVSFDPSFKSSSMTVLHETYPVFYGTDDWPFSISPQPQTHNFIIRICIHTITQPAPSPTIVHCCNSSQASLSAVLCNYSVSLPSYIMDTEKYLIPAGSSSNHALLKPRLVIHGGAGNIRPENYPPEVYKEYRDSLLDIVCPDPPHPSSLSRPSDTNQ